MRLSTKSRFAVAAMIDLALREQAGPVPLGSIGERLQISLSYLEQMFSKLRQQGLVDSTRGPGGGYTLARAAQAISVADIIMAVEGARRASGGAAGQQTRDLRATQGRTDEIDRAELGVCAGRGAGHPPLRNAAPHGHCVMNKCEVRR